MKKIINLLTLLLCVAVIHAQTVDRSIRPSAAPAKEIEIKDAKTFTLSNGLKVFVVEDHRAPVVYYSLQLDIKPALEGDKAGLQELFGGVMGTATKTKTKEQLNKEIDLIAAKINVHARGGYGSCLKKYETRLLELFSDMVLNPAFTQSELDLNKTQLKSGLQFINDDPAQLSRRLSLALAYGKNFPDGELETVESADKVTTGDLGKFYNTYFAPNAVRLVVVGNVTEAEAKANIQKYFGKWKKKNVPTATYIIPQAPDQSKVAMYNKDGAVQSVINLVYPVDFKPGAPDAEAASIANYILGGGMSGKLFQNLRETHSYTYGAYSRLKQGEHIGLFEISSGRTGGASVKAAATDSSLVQIIHEMRQMVNVPITEVELKAAQAYLAGSFGRSLQQPATIAKYAVNIDKYNLPKDYYKNYLKRVEAVTVADVQAAAKKYFKPENAWVVVIGDKAHADVLKQFATDKTVQFYDINANPVEAPVAKSTDMDAATILKNYVNAIGGEAALKKVNDLKSTATAEAMGKKLEMTRLFKTPNLYLMSISVSGAVMQKFVFDGTTLKMSVMGNNMEYTEGAEFEEIKASAAICPELNYIKNGYELTVGAIENVNGKDAYVLHVNKGEKTVTEYYDVETGLKIKTSATAKSPMGEIQQITEFGNYQTVDGIKFPFSVKQNAGGMGMEFNVQSVEINKGIDEALFK